MTGREKIITSIFSKFSTFCLSPGSSIATSPVFSTSSATEPLYDPMFNQAGGTCFEAVLKFRVADPLASRGSATRKGKGPENAKASA